MHDLLAVVPRERWSEAVELLVSPLPDEVRLRQEEIVLAALESDSLSAAGLLAHFRGDVMHAVCWLERQPGRTASFWPPVPTREQEAALDAALVAKALDMARGQNVLLVQTLLPTDAGPDAEVLRQAGFLHVADLLYLVSAAERFPSSAPTTDLKFHSLEEADWDRLERIVERTYVNSCDCPSLDGVRPISDVLESYRSVGRFRPELWRVALMHDKDIGCVLLADHAPLPVWELVYMGVAPEARGKQLGLEITRYSQWLAAREHAERLVLAVDAANEPAIAMYAAAGFVAWDRRSVFIHLISTQPAEKGVVL